MRVVDYYHYISDENFDLRGERTCLESYLLARGQKDYEFAADLCEKLGLKGVVDIGCSYGFQSEIFVKKRLIYHGIDNSRTHFWNHGENHVTFQSEEYPCFVNVDTKKMLAFSRFCVGHTMKDYEKVSEDFTYLLVDKKEETDSGLSRYFIHVSDLAADSESTVLYSLFARTEEEAERMRNCLERKEELFELHVCGLQFPREKGITVNRIMDLFEMTKGYYYDLIRIDGRDLSAYFVMDSKLYLAWEKEQIISKFTGFIKGILKDEKKKSPDDFYDFYGYKVYLGYM